MAVKQVLVVRKDLNMGKGKIAAQCAHASLKVFFDKGSLQKMKSSVIFRVKFWRDAIEWYNGSFAKVVVCVNSEDELLEIYQRACNAKIPSSLIVDAGRTKFHGVATKTVVGIGPFNSSVIDRITGNLKLL